MFRHNGSKRRQGGRHYDSLPFISSENLDATMWAIFSSKSSRSRRSFSSRAFATDIRMNVNYQYCRVRTSMLIFTPLLQA